MRQLLVKTSEARGVAHILWQAEDLLAEANIASARLDAEVLIAYVLKEERWQLILQPERQLSPFELAAFQEVLTRRLRREPLAYIVGEKEFWSLPLKVTPAVLIPRPETEILVEVTLEKVRHQTPDSSPQTVVDVGTGSGAIALALARELPQARMFATDCSPEALKIAAENARSLGLLDKVRFLVGDLFEPLPLEMTGKVNLLTSNPPYVRSHELGQLQPEVSRYEPRIALDGGPDGLMYHRRIITESPRFLKPGGLLTLEVGIGQAEAVVSSIEENGAYDTIEIVKDYAWHDRVVLARKRR